MTLRCVCEGVAYLPRDKISKYSQGNVKGCGWGDDRLGEFDK